jgi:hypothetical protein
VTLQCVVLQQAQQEEAALL